MVNKTARLSYKLMAASDANLLFELDQDPAVMEHINGGKTTSREAIETVFLPRMMEYRNTKKSWGKGYATEAAEAIMMALHKQAGYQTFSAVAVPDNVGSIRMMEKLGMTYQKTALHKDPLADMEAVYYSVTLD